MPTSHYITSIACSYTAAYERDVFWCFAPLSSLFVCERSSMPEQQQKQRTSSYSLGNSADFVLLKFSQVVQAELFRRLRFSQPLKKALASCDPVCPVVIPRKVTSSYCYVPIVVLVFRKNGEQQSVVELPWPNQVYGVLLCQPLRQDIFPT